MTSSVSVVGPTMSVLLAAGVRPSPQHLRCRRQARYVEDVLNELLLLLNEPSSRTHPTILPAVPIFTKSGRADPAQPPLPDPTTVDLAQGRVPQYRPHYWFLRKVDVQNRLSLLSPILPSSTSLKDASHNIARTTVFNEKWICISGSATSH